MKIAFINEQTAREIISYKHNLSKSNKDLISAKRNNVCKTVRLYQFDQEIVLSCTRYGKDLLSLICSNQRMLFGCSCKKGE